MAGTVETRRPEAGRLPGSAAAMALASLLLAPAALADHVSISFGGGAGGGLRTWSAWTLPRGHWSLGLRADLLENATPSDEWLAEHALDHGHADAVESNFTGSLGLAGGLRDDLSLLLRLPHVTRDELRSAEVHEGEDHAHVESLGDISGLGDLLAALEWRFVGDEHAALAVVAGLEMPTGRTDARDAEGRLIDVDHQPGSGSWDALIGLAASRAFGRSSVHGDLTWTVAGEGARNTRLGDVIQADAAFVHRFGGSEPHEHSSDAPVHSDGGWELIVEVGAEWRGETSVGGHSHDETMDDEGEMDADHEEGHEAHGHEAESSVWLSAGLRVPLGARWSLSAELGVPITSDTESGRPDWRGTLGLAVTF